MKNTIFKCDPLQPKAMLSLQMHRDANPNGAPLYGGRSRRKVYFCQYVIHETKTQVVIGEL